MTDPSTFCAELDPELHGSDLASVRDELREWLQASGVSEMFRNELLIAAGEACTNAVEHSGARASGGRPAAWIEATRDRNRVRVVVNDLGLWKPPHRRLRQPQKRGRGRSLMANMVDQVQICTGATGTAVLLIKECPMQDSPPGDPATRLRVNSVGPREVMVHGEIDAANVGELRAGLESARGDAETLFVDLRGVTYLDSAAVAVLFEQAHRGLSLHVVEGSAVATVIRICALPLVAEVEFSGTGVG